MRPEIRVLGSAGVWVRWDNTPWYHLNSSGQVVSRWTEPSETMYLPLIDEETAIQRVLDGLGSIGIDDGTLDRIYRHFGLE